jgi:leucyl-tRNA synthetase
MSKSKGNVVSPDDMIAQFGADATRMYALFAAPPDRDLEWQEEGVAGISRFLARVYRLTTKYAATKAGAPRLDFETWETPTTKAGAPHLDSEMWERPTTEPGAPHLDSEMWETPTTPASAALLRTLHQTIAKITEDFSGRWHFNTCIAAIMILVNEIAAAEAAMDAGEVDAATVAQLFRTLTLLLAPFAPFLAAELWEVLGERGNLFAQPWPVADAELARESEMEVPVQINGKLVTVLKLSADADDETIKAASLADEKVVARLEGKTMVKHLVIKKPSGWLVNLVVK